MKKIKGSINSISLTIYATKTLTEFKEGARLFTAGLEEGSGILFDFGQTQVISMENSGVQEDLCVLYFHKFSKYGIVQEVQVMKADTYGPYNSQGFYNECLELKKSFCDMNNVVVGSILLLNDSPDA